MSLFIDFSPKHSVLNIKISFFKDQISKMFVHLKYILFQDDDGLQPALRNNPNVMEELRDWQRVQKSQSILLDGNLHRYSLNNHYDNKDLWIGGQG